MADIYKKAQSVAVWLGPEGDDSDLATALLQGVATAAQTDAGRIQVKSIFTSGAQDKSLPDLAALFEREYWNQMCGLSKGCSTQLPSKYIAVPRNHYRGMFIRRRHASFNNTKGTFKTFSQEITVSCLGSSTPTPR